MSNSVCLNCGEIKFGALCECPNCNQMPSDVDIAILLTDHYLDNDELKRISYAIKIIYNTITDEEIRFYAVANYLGRKWPKIIDYDASKMDEDATAVIDENYIKYLCNLKGQENLSEKLKSNLSDDNWDRACNKEFQEEDYSWGFEVYDIVMSGLKIAEKIIKLKIRLGEGAVLQRIKYEINQLLHCDDHNAMSIEADLLKKDVEEYERIVYSFCKLTKNGWSGRTKERAAYLRGTCLRLNEMVKYCKDIAEYKTKNSNIVKIEYIRIKQKLNNSYNMYKRLIDVVLNPDKITEINE